MNLYEQTYILIELISVTLVLYTACKMSRDVGNDNEIRIFRWLQMTIVVGVITQILWVLSDYKYITYPYALFVAINVINVLALGISMYFWFRFAVEHLQRIKKDKLLLFAKRMQMVVVILQTIFIVTSIFTKFVFCIDENGVYQRGAYYWVHSICCYSNWLWTTILLLKCRYKESDSVKRQLDQMLRISVLPAVGGILQILWYGIPFLDASMAISTFFMFVDLQEEQITTDVLTGLNNRKRFLKIFERMIRNANEKPFYVYIADVDHFKKINDKYGHMEGDEALKIIAETLRTMEYDYMSLHACRYGGDEFAFLVETEDVMNELQLMEDLNMRLEDATADKEYGLVLSGGVQKVSDSKEDSILALKKADKNLYANKRVKRANRCIAMW